MDCYSEPGNPGWKSRIRAGPVSKERWQYGSPAPICRPSRSRRSEDPGTAIDSKNRDSAIPVCVGLQCTDADSGDIADLKKLELTEREWRTLHGAFAPWGHQRIRGAVRPLTRIDKRRSAAAKAVATKRLAPGWTSSFVYPLRKSARVIS